MSEAAWIEAARAGDLDAFNRLVLAYQDLVFNQAMRMIGETAAAEDASQEAFISAYRNLTSFRGGSFKAWLLRIVTNACYDELRRRQRRPTTPLEPLTDDDEEVESPHWLADESDLPEDHIERGELEAVLRQCLNDLPPDFRTAVVLVDLQGMDYNEAAAAAGTPVGTIKSRLARARLRMRQCLQGYGELLPAVYRLVEES